jgi:tetratricopeptide (TPR) repeat protein
MHGVPRRELESTGAGTSRGGSRAAFLVALLALASCSRNQDRTQPVATAEPKTSAPPSDDAKPPAATATDASSARTSPDGKASSSAPLSDADRAKHRTVLEALNRGRAATRANHLDEALEAFDEAAETDKGERARAERGYVYYLQKRYDRALEDFEEASNVPLDATLAAQVWFNRGLTYGALHRGTEADLAFYWSNRLNATDAAASRLTGKSICPVAVDRGRVEAKGYAGFLAWADAIAKSDTVAAGGYVSAPSEAAAKEQFCHACNDDGPWTVDFGGFEGSWPRLWDIHVLARRDGKVWDYGAFGAGYDGPVIPRCGIDNRIALVTDGPYVVVQTVDVPWTKVPVKMVDDQPAGECPNDSDWKDCSMWCMSSSSRATYALLDVGHHARVMNVVQDNYFDVVDDAHADVARSFPVAIHAAAGAFEMRGEACANVPFQAAAF